MAKKVVKKKPGISKIGRARAQIAKTPNKTNIEVAAICGNGVTAADVGNAKLALKKKAGKSTKKRGRRAKKTATGGGDLNTAINFVESCGGLPAAKALIEQIERIKSL